MINKMYVTEGEGRRSFSYPVGLQGVEDEGSGRATRLFVWRSKIRIEGETAVFNCQSYGTRNQKPTEGNVEGESW